MSLAEKARKIADEVVRKKQEEAAAQHKGATERCWSAITAMIEKESTLGHYECSYSMMVSKHEALPDPVLAALRKLLRAEKLTLAESPPGEPLVWKISWPKPSYRGLKKGDRTDPDASPRPGDVAHFECSCGAPSCDRCHSG